MNSRQLQYAVLLSKFRSFSQAAEQLNMSQSALSKHILHLEKELGVKLFDRNTMPISLTPAGDYFIGEAQRLLYQEDQLIHAMQQFQTGEAGRVTIGISPFRSLYMIPHVIQKFKEKYPKVQVCLHETNSDALRKEIAEGKLDFSIINLPVDESILDVIPLEADHLVLAVPQCLVQYLPYPGKKLPQTISFQDCRNLPFVAVGQSQEMRQLFNKLCTQADFIPNITAEVVGITTAFQMALVGVGATLLPLQFVDKQDLGRKLILFSLEDCVSVRQPAVVTRRGQYLSEYAKYAITLLTGRTM